jgi:hypothetical protein
MGPKKPKRVALYLRVSTGEQTTRNQRRELHAVAERHGWNLVATYEDAGVSGVKGRDERPGYDKLMKAVARREIDMWPPTGYRPIGIVTRNMAPYCMPPPFCSPMLPCRP